MLNETETEETIAFFVIADISIGGGVGPWASPGYACAIV